VFELIAEVGANHEGSLDAALDLIEQVSEIATAVKFQLFDPNKLYRYDERMAHRAKMQRIKPDWIPILRDFAAFCDLNFGCSVFHPEFLSLVDDGWNFIKLASGTYQDEDLHRAVDELEIPIIASLPADKSVQPWLDWHAGSISRGQFTVLVCSTQYPTPLWDAGIRRVGELSEWSYLEDNGITIGYSDHTLALDIGGFVYCLGGRVFEKHVKRSHECYSPDAPNSVTPTELFTYAQHIHNASDALRLKCPSEGELGRVTQKEGGRANE